MVNDDSISISRFGQISLPSSSSTSSQSSSFELPYLRVLVSVMVRVRQIRGVQPVRTESDGFGISRPSMLLDTSCGMSYSIPPRSTVYDVTIISITILRLVGHHSDSSSFSHQWDARVLGGLRETRYYRGMVIQGWLWTNCSRHPSALNRRDWS
jgi:hypothetical protein